MVGGNEPFEYVVAEFCESGNTSQIGVH